jgi:hypothetical protein
MSHFMYLLNAPWDRLECLCRDRSIARIKYSDTMANEMKAKII